MITLLACTQHPPEPPHTLALVVAESIPARPVEKEFYKMQDWLSEQGITLKRTPTRTLSLTDPLGGADTTPLKSLLQTLAIPARPEVCLVVVFELAGPRSAAARTLGTLDGLALSPQYTPLGLSLELPAQFSPLVLISWAQQQSRLPEDRVWTWIHELGHIAGLSHTQTPDNLMTPDGGTGLTSDQIQRFQEYFNVSER